MSKFRNIKVRVGDPETSRKVQEKLFEDGCRWYMAGKKPNYVNMPHIYVSFDGDIHVGNTESFFKDYGCRELTPAEILCEAEEWNGTGLPPVGCECELHCDDDEWCFRKDLVNGAKVKIVAHATTPSGFDVAVFTFTGSQNDMHAETAVAGCFRPICTEEEKQREADRAELERIFEETKMLTLPAVIDRLVEAGFTRGGDKKKAP